MVPETGATLAAMPFTVEVRPALCVHEAALLLIMLMPVPVTPFTVVVRVLELDAFATELTIGTVLPETPFTEVLKLLPLEVLLTELTAGAVADTPFTVLVMVLVVLVSVWVVAPLSTVAAAVYTGAPVLL